MKAAALLLAVVIASDLVPWALRVCGNHAKAYRR